MDTDSARGRGFMLKEGESGEEWGRGQWRKKGDSYNTLNNKGKKTRKFSTDILNLKRALQILGVLI